MWENDFNKERFVSKKKLGKEIGCILSKHKYIS